MVAFVVLCCLALSAVVVVVVVVFFVLCLEYIYGRGVFFVFVACRGGALVDLTHFVWVGGLRWPFLQIWHEKVWTPSA